MFYGNYRHLGLNLILVLSTWWRQRSERRWFPRRLRATFRDLLLPLLRYPKNISNTFVNVSISLNLAEAKNVLTISKGALAVSKYWVVSCIYIAMKHHSLARNIFYFHFRIVYLVLVITGGGWSNWFNVWKFTSKMQHIITRSANEERIKNSSKRTYIFVA